MGKTYSFRDVNVIVSNPSFGQYIATGAGLGEITVSMTTERTSHDVAADGTVMVSKVEGENGTIAMQIQQNSDFHKWLIRLYNFVNASDASQWANTTVLVRSLLLADMETATGVSFQKMADRVYQAQGQKVAWTLMAAHIDHQ